MKCNPCMNRLVLRQALNKVSPKNEDKINRLREIDVKIDSQEY